MEYQIYFQSDFFHKITLKSVFIRNLIHKISFLKCLVAFQKCALIFVKLMENVNL